MQSHTPYTTVLGCNIGTYERWVICYHDQIFLPKIGLDHSMQFPEKNCILVHKRQRLS